ncbi:gluconokinase [Rhizobium bangladeshense]|uniref:gluconokinase n=1 Tax=Rhizobium bangladeshense TaxID=1138189 RepID=UPI001A988718|nr:gluconokinase [Rhizobium bangladeshense]MBX4896293.1 gluconokinase [Rhizobium bangladeshense]MBX4902150.1 gluconokinase [Rhizobium bangladeshense]MBX4932446.1 gluconokinase [Rhizobium bangladeshense]MBY3579746.1 gluconokinase [Rhizobium bangladeshense]MBY3613741.1 gluconokinase [Rhizobium bangladeshense]
MPDQRMNRPHAIIVMGVSGCGKSSVGEKIAEALRLDFVEGDALHPASNVEKMSKGIPLTDEDRMPWLDLIGKRMQASLDKCEGIIVSCSALKRIYRDRLRAAAGNLFFVYLEGSKALLAKRMGERKGHFMPVSLLESQLATLEVPTGEPGVVTVDIDDTVEGITVTALRGLSTLGVTA